MGPEGVWNWVVTAAGCLPAEAAVQSETEAERDPEELEPTLAASGEWSQRRSPKTRSKLNVSHLYLVSRGL